MIFGNRGVRSAALLAGLSITGLTQAQITTEDLTEGTTAQELAEFLAGNSVTIENATYVGADVATGRFGGALNAVGLAAGVILSSGEIASVTGPNNAGGAGSNLNSPGDDELTAFSGNQTYDAAVLEFDITPTQETISFSYVFGSEEYNEFVGSSFNDVFALLVNGVNCALVPDTTTPIAVNNVNNETNPAFYIDNSDTENPVRDTQLDGLTTVLSCVAAVQPNVPNRLKFAIADAGDAILDSAVFIGAGTLISGTAPVAVLEATPVEGEAPLLVTFSTAGTSDAEGPLANWTLSFGDGESVSGTGTPPAAIEHEYPPGAFLAVLTVIDSDNNQSSDSQAIKVFKPSQTLVFTNAPASISEAAGSGQIVVSRNTGVGEASVTVSGVSGTATLGSDFYLRRGDFTSFDMRLDFSEGVTAIALRVDVTDDTVVEGNEAFEVQLTDAVGGKIGTPGAVTITLIDDDDQQTETDSSIRLSQTSYSATEGESVEIVLAREGSSAEEASVRVATSDVSAISGQDYTALNETVTWPAGDATPKSIFVPITDDSDIDADEMFRVSVAPLSSAVSLGSPSAASVNVLDNDASAQASIQTSAGPVAISVGTGLIEVLKAIPQEVLAGASVQPPARGPDIEAPSFGVSLDIDLGSSGGAVTVTFSPPDGFAEAPDDVVYLLCNRGSTACEPVPVGQLADSAAGGLARDITVADGGTGDADATQNGIVQLVIAVAKVVNASGDGGSSGEGDNSGGGGLAPVPLVLLWLFGMYRRLRRQPAVAS